jgi:hypothetical protein
VCNVETEKEFLITTLEMFGLEKNYMTGTGHFPTWERDQQANAKNKKAKTKKQAAKKAGKQDALAARKAKYQADKGGEAVKPTHFDLEPIRIAIKRFISCSADVRTEIRTMLTNFHDNVRDIFKDEDAENSFKKCIDINELAPKLLNAGLEIENPQNIGPIFRCFGCIEVEEGWGLRQPAETDEMKKAKLLLSNELDKQEKTRKEKEKKEIEKPMTEEEIDEAKKAEEETLQKIAQLTATCKPKAKQLMLLEESSISDLLEAVIRMADYDRLMNELDPRDEEEKASFE